MMRAIKLFIFSICFFPVVVFANTDKSCLDHLGGATLNIQCYLKVTGELEKANDGLYVKILNTMPKGNKNKYLLESHKKEQRRLKKYCELSRSALEGWSVTKQQSSPRYFDYDEAYYECLYNLAETQNNFLKGLLESASK